MSNDRLVNLLTEATDGDKDWAVSVAQRLVKISERAECEELRGKIGRITDVVIPNSDPCVFYFISDSGNLEGWVFYEEILIEEE